MDPIIKIAALIITVVFTLPAHAQSTTGGRSGGSTASTGTGYLTEGKRVPAGSPASITIADEGASRAYMYVPQTNAKNRSTSPDGSGSAKSTPHKSNSSITTKTQRQVTSLKKTS